MNCGVNKSSHERARRVAVHSRPTVKVGIFNTLNLAKTYCFTAHNYIRDQYVGKNYTKTDVPCLKHKSIDQQAWCWVTQCGAVSNSSDVCEETSGTEKSFSVFSHGCLLAMRVATVTHDISFPGNAKAQSLVPFFFCSLSCSIRSSKGGKCHLLFILTLFM